MDNLNNKKILIIRLSAIGDTIHTLPLLGAIKKKYPEAHVYWLVERASSFLLNKNPLLEKIFIFDKADLFKSPLDGFKKLKQLIKDLKAEEFDISIDVQGLLKSGIFTWLSGAKRKIGFKNTREFADLFLTEKVEAGDIFDSSEHIIEKNLILAEYLGIEIGEVNFPLPEPSQETKSKVDSLLQDIKPGLPVICVIPSTTWPSKFWKEEYWKELLKYLSDKFTIVTIGTEQDSELISRITSHLIDADLIDLTGKTSLIELIEVFNRVDAVIGVDTGPLHLAVAVKKPEVFAILGPTCAVRNGAYKHKNLHTDKSCYPCKKKICPNNELAYMTCMESIKPDHVIYELSPLFWDKGEQDE